MGVGLPVLGRGRRGDHSLMYLDRNAVVLTSIPLLTQSKMGAWL